MRSVKDFAEKNANAGALFLFVMSHGSDDSLEWEDGSICHISEVIQALQTSDNKEQPKVCILPNIDLC